MVARWGPMPEVVDSLGPTSKVAGFGHQDVEECRSIVESVHDAVRGDVFPSCNWAALFPGRAKDKAKKLQDDLGRRQKTSEKPH